jgi:hypothetical protein
MRKILLGLVLVLSAMLVRAQTALVSGTIQNPDGSPFNGYVSIALTKASLVNACVSPAQVVPFPGLLVKVTAGVFAPTHLLPTSCLTPRLPYYVQVKDAHQRVLFSDNWYIPQTVSGTVDIGMLGSVQLASGITVSVPLALISTPVGNQTIAQPSGTNLTINNLIVSNSFGVTGTFTAAGLTTSSLTVNGAAIVVGTLSLVGSMNADNSIISSVRQLGIGTPSPAYSLDVATGSINTHLSYGINGNFGTTGYCLASGGSATVADVWVPCLTSVTLYNQYVNSAYAAMPQRGVLQFGTAFALTDSTSPVLLGGHTQIDLAAAGTAGTYAYPSSMTTDAYGRVTSVTAGSGASSGSNVHGYWTLDAGGTLTQHAANVAISGDTFVTFPVAFTNASSVSVVASFVWTNGDSAYPTIVAGSVSTTGFTVHPNSNPGIPVNWIAVGR